MADTDPDSRAADLERAHGELALHLISAHAFTPHVLTRTLAEQMADHEHEHNGPGTIRNHPREARNFSADKIEAAFREHASVEESEARYHDDVTPKLATARPQPHAVAEVLRELALDVETIDSFGLHGTILRSDVRSAIRTIAHKHGVILWP
jgi:hypothetical protein